MSEAEMNKWYRRSDWQDRWPSSQPVNILQAATWAIYDVLGLAGPMLSRYSGHRNLYKQTVTVEPVEIQDSEPARTPEQTEALIEVVEGMLADLELQDMASGDSLPADLPQPDLYGPANPTMIYRSEDWEV